MARIKNGILGPYVGTIGPVVGTSRNGVHYLKSRPKRRRRKRESGEKLNQDKFSVVHYWLQPLIDYLREGFKGSQSGAYNAAKSYALKHAVKEDSGKWKVDPSLIKISQGTLPIPDDIKVTRDENNVLQFSWGISPSGGSSYDQVMVVAYNGHKEFGKERGQFRSNLGDTLELGKSSTAKYHIYISFIADDRSRQSESVYLGLI